jgi:hypothetical protein
MAQMAEMQLEHSGEGHMVIGHSINPKKQALPRELHVFLYSTEGKSDKQQIACQAQHETVAINALIPSTTTPWSQADLAPSIME